MIPRLQDRMHEQEDGFLGSGVDQDVFGGDGVVQACDGLAERRADREAMLRYLDAQLAIEPEDVAARGARSIILFETGRHAASLDELDEILRQQPAGLDLERIRQLRDYFERRASQPQAATR